MRITIDNLDGLGAVDYSAAVAAEGPVVVQRALNVPSRCTAELALGVGRLVLPVRRARVVVTSDEGGVLFTGYLATEPVRVYAGEASEGAVYRARLSAVSDEWLLDKLGSGTGRENGVMLALNGGTLIARLVQHVGAGGISAATTGAAIAVGAFAGKAAAPWSENAGAAASAAYAGYRAVDGVVLTQTAGTTAHALSDADGTLVVSELATTNVRELANDVTVSGEEEPAAFVQECFVGDGTTAEFALSEAAFRGASRTLIRDRFSEAAIDTQQWVASDPASALSLTAAGLTMNGGTGADGVTLLEALDAVEMGGSVVAELGGVVVGAASVGVLAGFYQGPTVLAACFAGFRVKQSGGVTVMVPVVSGVEIGTVFTPVAGHRYTLRLRLHCVEMVRVNQRYACMVDGVIESFGDPGGVAAPMNVVFELVDEGTSSNTPATVLHDSFAAGVPLLGTPATCVFAAVNATQMFGSVASVSVTRPGSLWVTSVLRSGVQQTRLTGSAGEGVDCAATYGTAAGTGTVTFFAGRVPVANERVTVSYRSSARSVARLADAASVAAEAAGGTQGTARWLGKVLAPIARSSVDCENAAAAILAFAASRAAAVAGTYGCVNPSADIWPGDVLAVTSAGVTTHLLVRSVAIHDEHCAPEVVRYRISFANDWATELADGIGLRLSEEIAADALLPQTALGLPGTAGTQELLANLQQLAVTALTETTLQVDAGTAPPAGGGFEVRRHDGGFGASGTDLVLRSPVRSFSIPRVAQVEQFFVRMYDASVPAVYSRWSSAVFVTAPVS